MIYCKEERIDLKGYIEFVLSIKYNYTQDKLIQYIRAKGRIMDYLETNEFITNQTIRELCGYTKQQARATIDRLKAEEGFQMVGSGKGAKYCLQKK